MLEWASMGANCVRQAAEQTVERPTKLLRSSRRNDNVMPDSQDSDLNIAGLMKAASEGDVSVIQYLVHDCDADVNTTCRDADGTMALLRAASCGHVRAVRFVATECGADVNATTNNGVTALMVAAAGNSV